jgi:autotransporter-associated beta strand protein
MLVFATNNSYSGVTLVSAGTLQIGSGGGFGSLGSGVVTNLAALVFNRTNDFTVANLIHGTGSLTKQGGGALTLSGANTYHGVTTISAGTLRAGNAAALGSLTNGTMVTSGATLDVNGFSLGAEVVNVIGAGVGGNGAIFNNGATQTNALRFVTFTGNTTFGGANRWDLRDPGTGGASALSGGGFTLTKVATNQVWLANLGSTALGDIVISAGTLFVHGTTTLGDPAKTLSVNNGAAFGISATGTNALNKLLALTSANVSNVSGSNNFSGAATLSGLNRFDIAAGSALAMTGIVGGTGGLQKTNSGTVVLARNNPYAGNTTINGGTLTLAAAGAIPSSPVLQVDAGALLDVSAVTGGFILAPGQTLRGNGVVLGNFSALGTVAPGASIGRLICSNSVMLAGNLVMETSKAGSTLTNDVLLVGGTLTLGGNLTVTHSGNAPAAGDTFPLFTAANLGGNFANENLPGLTAGLRWDSSSLATDGKLRVAAITPPTIQPVSFDGTNLLLQVSSETGVSYVLEATPSLDAPVFWTAIATNSGTGGLLTFPISVSAESPQQFFRMATY